MQDFDFAIVGAGIAGVSAAYHLAPHARVIVLEREHVAAYHTTGRSAALHSETYGSAEIRAITVSSGRFYRKPPPGFADHPLLTPRGALIAGRAEQQAALQKAAADYARLVPSVRWLDPAETLRRQPLLKPEAAAGGAIFEPEADDMDVAAIHGGFLRGARAAGCCAAARRRDHGARAQGRPMEDQPARRRERRRHDRRQRLGRVGRRRGRPGRRQAGRAGAQAPHRLHLRRAGRAWTSCTCRWSSTSTRPGTSSPRSASSSPRRPTRRRRRPATPSPRRWTSPSPSSASRRRRRCEIRAHQEQVGGPQELRRRQEPGGGLRPRGRGLVLAGRPGRLWHPDGRVRRAARGEPGAGQGHARRYRRTRRERSGPFTGPLHAAVIGRSRFVA